MVTLDEITRDTFPVVVARDSGDRRILTALVRFKRELPITPEVTYLVSTHEEVSDFIDLESALLKYNEV